MSSCCDDAGEARVEVALEDDERGQGCMNVYQWSYDGSSAVPSSGIVHWAMGVEVEYGGSFFPPHSHLRK